MSDPREAMTLGDACQNPDGTYNTFKMLSWMSEVLNPGNGMTEADVRRVYDERKKNEQRARSANPGDAGAVPAPRDVAFGG